MESRKRYIHLINNTFEVLMTLSSTARAYTLSSFVRTAHPRLNAAAGRADSRLNAAAGRADSRLNAAAGRADSRLNAAAGRAAGRTGPWCSSGGLVWAALSTRDPLQHRYLHTLRQGSTATAVLTHVTTGVHCTSSICTHYSRD